MHLTQPGFRTGRGSYNPRMTSEHPTPSPGAPSAEARRRVQGFVIELGRLGQELTVAIAGSTGDSELTGNLPMMVLMELDIGGPRRPRELQRLTGLTSVQVTRLVDRLAERGVVSRTTGGVPGDGRATVVSLTPAGARITSLVVAGREGRLDEVRASLRTLLAQLDEMAANRG